MIHDWAHTRLYWCVSLSQCPILLGCQFVCTHSICQGEVVCVCIFVSVEGLREGRIGRRKEEGQIKAEQWQKGRRGQHRQENVLSHSLSLSRSLSYPPTHSSKYNDHRKVISKLSQSEDGESTESNRNGKNTR